MNLLEPVPSLTRWGLSPDADLVYRSLAAIGPGTVGSLSAGLGITRHRVSMAIDELHVTGAVRGPHVPESPPAARRWQAMPVADVVAALRQRRLRTVDLRYQAGFHHALLQGSVLPTPTPPPAHGRVLLTSGEIRARIATLVAAERHEHLAVNPEPSFAEEDMAEALPLDRALVARGIRLRTCGVPPLDADRSSAVAHQLASIGADYRERTDVPVKLMVFDRRIALLPVDPFDPSAGALEIDHPVIVAGLVALFEQLWGAGRDPRRGGVPPIVLSPRERSIVALLATGLTDAGVATRLNISRRTIAYTLRALMDRIGAENRFQLGLILGSMHLLTPPGRPAGAADHGGNQ
ncbi:helix-turn-helix domain-containing protein [Virgisporangium ochraceum]|uniref:helix-turn-helix domain-containing protein n=1 Tax=Virgisporangium ochraceum TaxID=65505 RepID=UPI0019454C0E|nr:helix-turn-helix domain-containing protein [Virgisporangium ochraceum]